MKSNFKSYRVRCTECSAIHVVINNLMDQDFLILYCRSCVTRTEFRKVD